MTCDSGRLRNGGDGTAPCEASQSGNRPNRTTQVIEQLLDKGLANAVSQHRATREPSPSGLGPDGRVSAFAAICDDLMRPSENVQWLERAGRRLAEMNELEETSRRARAAEKAAGEDHGD